MTDNLHFETSEQAVRDMVDAGAVFTVRHRNDSFGISFTYSVGDGGDLERCRAILAQVKGKSPQHFAAFKMQVQHLVGGAANA